MPNMSVLTMVTTEERRLDFKAVLTVDFPISCSIGKINQEEGLDGETR